MYAMKTLIVLCLALVNIVSGSEKDMTFIVEPGRSTCFFEEVPEGHTLEVDYQVIDGAHGDLDITFYMADPHGRVLVQDYKKSENSHQHESKETGEYKFCFDNTFSTFNAKTVFFEIIIDNDQVQEEDNDYNDREMELPGGLGEATYMMRVRDITESVARVKDQLAVARRLQEAISAHEARDRNRAEENNSRVLVWSAVQIAVMVCVGFVQVVMVKSLFEDNSKVRGVWSFVPQRLS